MSWRRLSAIMRKELQQLRRDRLTLVMIIGIPVLQLLLFGYAINLNLRNLPAAIADEAGTSGSRALAMDLIASNVIELTAEAHSPQELMSLLRQGRISVGIAIPPDFETRLAQGREAVQILVDGSDTVVQSAATQLAQLPLSSVSAITPSEPAISVIAFYNPERRTAVNIVPGLIGVILTMTMVLFTAVAIVRERERGNLELLITMPISKAELMIGKILPYAVIGLLQTTLILVIGMTLFAVPVLGSLIAVYVSAILLILANLTLGLLISTRAKTQFQAMQMTFFVFLPSVLISGFMFPYAGMPRPVQWLAEILPLTHFLRLIRGVMLRGASLRELWVDVLGLLVFTIIVMALAITRFRKRLD